MQAEDKVALHIDELQPSMLQGYWRFGLLYGLLNGIVIGVVLGMFWGPVFGLAIGVPSSLLFALPGSLTLEEDVKILVGLAWGVSALLIEGPLACLIVALIFIFITDNEPRKISPIIALHPPTSYRKWLTFISLLLASLGYGFIMGIYSGAIIGLVHVRGISMEAWLAFTSAFAPALFFLIGGAYALRMIAGPARKTIYPQERLNDALYNSLTLFPLFNLAAILLFLQILSLAEQLNVSIGTFYNMSLFYTVLLMFAVLSFWVLGTNIIFQHYLLRLCLRIEQQLPLRLVSWLNAMHQRKVFQRVGGRYHFLHKQLRDYLAKLAARS